MIKTYRFYKKKLYFFKKIAGLHSIRKMPLLVVVVVVLQRRTRRNDPWKSNCSK